VGPPWRLPSQPRKLPAENSAQPLKQSCAFLPRTKGVNPGNANLPIGELQNAIPQNGVPGRSLVLRFQRVEFPRLKAKFKNCIKLLDT
jgi:hypothetical protein